MMRKPLDEILEQCIARLEAGEDIKAVLAGYPEQADELRAHLEIWASLSATERAEATPRGAARGRELLLKSVAESRSERESDLVRSFSSMGGLGMRYAAALVAGAALALGAMFLVGALDSGGGSTAEAGPFEECILQLDFNGDGRLDVQDVEAFRAAIENQDPAFDYNGDGTVDVFDVVGVVQEVVTCLQNVQPPAP